MMSYKRKLQYAVDVTLKKEFDELHELIGELMTDSRGKLSTQFLDNTELLNGNVDIKEPTGLLQKTTKKETLQKNSGSKKKDQRELSRGDDSEMIVPKTKVKTLVISGQLPEKSTKSEISQKHSRTQKKDPCQLSHGDDYEMKVHQIKVETPIISGDPCNVYCFKCHKNGHVDSACRSCWLCGLSDHSRKECNDYWRQRRYYSQFISDTSISNYAYASSVVANYRHFDVDYTTAYCSNYWTNGGQLTPDANWSAYPGIRSLQSYTSSSVFTRLRCSLSSVEDDITASEVVVGNLNRRSKLVSKETRPESRQDDARKESSLIVVRKYEGVNERQQSSRQDLTKDKGKKKKPKRRRRGRKHGKLVAEVVSLADSKSTTKKNRNRKARERKRRNKWIRKHLLRI